MGARSADMFAYLRTGESASWVGPAKKQRFEALYKAKVLAVRVVASADKPPARRFADNNFEQAA